MRKHAIHRSNDPDADRMPSHVAIIMDGSGRWAKSRLLNRVRGHEKGADTVRAIVRACREIEIPYLTLYAFSTENWQRPKSEVSALMELLTRFLKSEQRELRENNIRLNTIGRQTDLPDKVQNTLRETMKKTAGNTGLTLTLALSYGGRDEIVHMVREMAKRAAAGNLPPDDITQETIAEHLYTRGMPDPDLLIRTSGEMRVSNFLLWQIAYAEIFITDTLWPDFTRKEFLEIIKAFQARDRRFGKVENRGSDPGTTMSDPSVSDLRHAENE